MDLDIKWVMIRLMNSFFLCVLCDSNSNLASEQILQFVIGHSIVDFNCSNEQLRCGKEPVLFALPGWNGCLLLFNLLICTHLIQGIAFYNIVFIHKLLYHFRGLKQKRYISYNHVTTIFTTHFKKIELLQQVFSDSCEKYRYMSHTVVLFWPAAIDKIYCDVSLDCRNRSSLLRHTTAALYKLLQYTCFSGIRHSYSGAP